MEAEPFDVPPEEEARLILAIQKILDDSGVPYLVTGITYKSVGVMGDGRTHEYGVIITPQSLAGCDVTLQQRLGTQIINGVVGVNRTTFEIPLNFPGQD